MLFCVYQKGEGETKQSTGITGRGYDIKRKVIHLTSHVLLPKQEYRDMLNLISKIKMKKKLNNILPANKGKLKGYLIKPSKLFKIRLKQGAVESIKFNKGYKFDSDLAEALRTTPQYLSMLMNGKADVTCHVIIAFAVLLNNIDGNWWSIFEIVNTGSDDDPNHPRYNTEKYEGRMPYREFSASAEQRKKDYKTEETK